MTNLLKSLQHYASNWPTGVVNTALATPINLHPLVLFAHAYNPEEVDHASRYVIIIIIHMTKISIPAENYLISDLVLDLFRFSQR